MKIISKILIPVVFSTSIYAQEIQNVPITLSDIKEALYGLLLDSKQNRENIEILYKKEDNLSKGTTKRHMDNRLSIKNNLESITNNREAIDFNENNITAIYNTLKKHGYRIGKSRKDIKILRKRIEKLEMHNILYKEEIEAFVKENKSILPEE